MSRYREISTAELNPAQKRVHDQIIAGARGRFGGPFQLLIRAPDICEHASKLGEHLRWGTSLSDRLSELAIITTARFWRAQYEWYAHAPLAAKAGVPTAAIEAIRTGGTPKFSKSDEQAIYDFASELVKTKRVSAGVFERAKKELTETGVIDMVGVIGYYSLVSVTLNAFELPLPDGEKVPFDV